MPFDERDFPDLPKGERATSPGSRRLVAIWLYSIAGMILVMIVLGGATRLTGSGLSIMEWAPIMGTIPPMTDAEWRRLFALYQQIPQYSLMNEGFGLDGFRHIFWLEWTHRLWGRLIGAAFVIPFVWLMATGRLERRLLPKLLAFLVLGGLQGAVGWFMVESGFFPDATAVAPLRLAAHLTLALILYGAVLWTALSLGIASRRDTSPNLGTGLRRGIAQRPGTAPELAAPGQGGVTTSRGLKALVWATLGSVALTIMAGGLVAGLHAGLSYNTFPLMDGRLVPNGYGDLEPFSRNLIGNIAAVQFNHRVLATLTALLASALAIVARRHREQLGWRAAFVCLAALLQYCLGVATLLLVVPPGLAILHQFGATVLLTAVLIVAHSIRQVSGNSAGNVRAHGETARGTPFHRQIRSSVVSRWPLPRSELFQSNAFRSDASGPEASRSDPSRPGDSRSALPSAPRSRAPFPPPPASRSPAPRSRAPRSTPEDPNA